MNTDKKATFHFDSSEGIYNFHQLPLLETQTLQNTAYRRVLETTGSIQVVAMSLLPGQGIKEEVHPTVTQMLRVVSGKITTKVDKVTSVGGRDSWIIIPPGSKHTVLNDSYSQTLKLYSIYSPPQHPKELVETNQPRDESIE